MKNEIYSVLPKAILKVGLIIDHLDYGVKYLHIIRYVLCYVINLALPFIKRETKHLQIIYFLTLLHIQNIPV